MKPRFIVYALPRSRTYWMSKFLSYGDWACGHDQLRYMRSLDDIKNWLAIENCGTCETGAAPFWRLVHQYAPDIKVITIRRPVEEVVESLVKIGIGAGIAETRKIMANLDRKLDQIEGRVPGVRSVQYSDLKDEIVCAELFEFCLPYGHDSARWKDFDKANHQVNFAALRRYLAANKTAVDKLWAQAKRASFASLSARPVTTSSVEIQEGSFSDWIEGCAHLINDHVLIIKDHPDNWINNTLNIPVLGKLHEAGFLQIMIARSNGRPFGYLVTLLSPSLESPGRKSAQHTAFYAAKEFPWLGTKLQREANRALQKKGFNEVFMRAGIRGDGERTGVLYERMGAQKFGQLYKMELES